MKEFETDILVIGGGPVGMTCAVITATAGARTMLVDRKTCVSYYPKARALTARSLELFRQLGIEESVYEAMPASRTRYYAFAAQLTADDIRRVPFGLAGIDPRPDTPSRGSYCTQDRLEPILEDRLRRESAADMRLAAELVALDQSAERVSALMRDVADGSQFKVTARLAVAADGANSRCAELLGLGCDVKAELEPAVTVIFKARLSHLVDPLDSVYVLLGEPGAAFGGMLSGVSLARDPEEWSLVTTAMPAWGTALTPATVERWSDAIRQLTGIPDLRVEISAVAKWRRTASVARQLRMGRTIFVGDSAHLMPPAGGLGLNTGLQDAHNLAWRLVAVLNGSDISVLDSYERERLPEIHRAVDAALANYDQGAQLAKIWSVPQIGLSLGVQYEAGSFVADDAAPERRYPYQAYQPSGRPGGRAPHFWLDESGKRSVLDLFGEQFVLLTAKEGTSVCAAVARMRKAGAPIRTAILDKLASEEAMRAWQRSYGVDHDGAILVRPDGYVAWRSRAADGDGLEECFWTIILHNRARRWAPAVQEDESDD